LPASAIGVIFAAFSLRTASRYSAQVAGGVFTPARPKSSLLYQKPTIPVSTADAYVFPSLV
jgi:hypothetical protein